MATTSKSVKTNPQTKAKKIQNPDSDLKVNDMNEGISSLILQSWVQDASLEVPMPPAGEYAAGERELEFSVGMSQQSDESITRSELRARALIHARGVVLTVVEASYVAMHEKMNVPEILPQYLYLQLKPHLEKLFAITGHVPPLPKELQTAK